MKYNCSKIHFPFILLLSVKTIAQTFTKLDNFVKEESSKVIAWRRELHQHPELSNREFNTSKKVADHLRSLGIETKIGIAKTGVVGILKGTKPGPVIALRADMDALPLLEKNNLLFKSIDSSFYNGKKVPVMHACGHDAHTAILMGVAEILSKLKQEIKGTVVFIFQPAEESAPSGEEGGASLMIKEGVLDTPKVDVIFGLHMSSNVPIGHLQYKSGAVMASADIFKIKVIGKSTHGANPWNGVDPIYVSSQIIQALQSIVSRESDLTKAPVVISIGTINAGVRFNVIPEEAELVGTVRNLDKTQQDKVLQEIKFKAEQVAKAFGANAEVFIEKKYPITFNNEKLTELVIPSLEFAVGKDKVKEQNWTTISEDFSFYQEKIPGFFFFLGGMPDNLNSKEASNHHSSEFYIDDSKLDAGIKAFCQLVFDYPRFYNDK